MKYYEKKIEIRLAMPRNGLTLLATISLVICEGDSDDSVLSMKLSWLSMNSLYLSSIDFFLDIFG